MIEIPNLETLRALAPIAGAFASGMASLAAIVGLKRRAGEWLAKRGEKKRHRAALKEHLSRVRAEWYVATYRKLCCHPNGLADSLFHDLSVQQAAARAGEPLPAWAKDGWEWVRMSRLNKATI
jgi:hypothetical protein